MLIQQGHQIFPTLALAVVMLARGDEPAIVKVSDAGVEQVRFGTITIPTDHQGNMLLPFRPDTMSHFDQISAADLLAGRVAPDRLRGKIAFLGSSANATSDTHPTPLDRQLPGILTHAVAADAMLRQDFLHTPGWEPAVQLFLILLSLAGTAFMLTRYLLWLCAAVCGVVMAGLWFAALWLLARYGLVISPVAPMLALGTGAVLLGLIRFRGEERGIIQMSRDLAMAQDCAIIGLVSVVETHDAETGRHIIRTRHYVRLLAERLSSHPRFCHGLTPENIEAIVRSAALHDIGKVGVADAILKKPGPLNEAETLTMRQHTLLGKRILEQAYRLSGADPRHSFLAHGVEIACSHHECWDGSGYPSGLKGEEIPIAARLMALADVYDALRSKRPYKESMPHEEVQACIQSESGTRFDPDVVRAFRDTHEAFHAFSDQHADDHDEREERVWSADLLGLEV
jgi:adenylate cyclase